MAAPCRLRRRKAVQVAILGAVLGATFCVMRTATPPLLDDFKLEAYRHDDVTKKRSSPAQGEESLQSLLARVARAMREFETNATREDSDVRTRLNEPKRKSNLCQNMSDAAKRSKLVISDVIVGAPLNHDDDVTMVTTLSLDRFDKFDRLMNNWKGPIVVAMYVPYTDLVHATRELFNKTRDKKHVTLHIMAEHDTESVNVTLVKSMRWKTCPICMAREQCNIVTSVQTFYPVNHLRNLALRGVKSRYVFINDVDFVPITSLYDRILRHTQVLRSREKSVLVIPAFEVSDDERLRDFPENKEQLLPLLRTDVIRPFHHLFRAGHGPSQYPRWKNTSDAYQVRWRSGYEPYIVIQRHLSPPFWERFIHRGTNKASYIMEIAARGFEFWVVPDGFTVHLPHSHSPNEMRFQTCNYPVYIDFLKYINSSYNFP